MSAFIGGRESRKEDYGKNNMLYSGEEAVVLIVVVVDTIDIQRRPGFLSVFKLS